MKEIDLNDIQFVDVLKGELVVVKYGDKGKNGVVEIKMKKVFMENVLYVLDGKVILKKEMDVLELNKIESINILKGEQVIKKYGDKGVNGVIEISIKKLELKEVMVIGY